MRLELGNFTKKTMIEWIYYFFSYCYMQMNMQKKPPTKSCITKYNNAAPNIATDFIGECSNLQWLNMWLIRYANTGYLENLIITDKELE